MPITLRTLLTVIIAMASLSTAASDLETLIMPGKVIAGHAKWEAACEKCHERFSKSTQDRLCLDCHRKIAADVERHQGLHGRTHNGTDKPCKACHSEHKGREADIVHLDTDTFDHAGTDFPLEGGHVGVACAACHKRDAKYRDAPSACNDCHGGDDPHKGRLGKDCATCHSVKAWKTQRFDHDKTRFPLHGKHKQAACNSCHPNERYKDIATACVACHGINDVHEGRYGAKCGKCHDERKWKEVIFDHNRDTKYTLSGGHRSVPCDTCHTGKLYEDKVSTGCYECHKHDDRHTGRYGKKCEACHATRDWRHTAFNHDKDTRFALKGAHKEVGCQDCHRAEIEKDKGRTACYDCHLGDDVHKGKEGKLCARCHNEEQWDKRVVFDHDMTRFPLIGLHVAVPCEECHPTTGYKLESFRCNDCHRKADVHKLTLGDDCALCHNPNGWRVWRFDHDTQSQYKLVGAHKKVLCGACHREPVRDAIRLPKDCRSCHLGEDVHNGSFGPHCERCHTTESFRDIRFTGRRRPGPDS